MGARLDSKIHKPELSRIELVTSGVGSRALSCFFSPNYTHDNIVRSCSGGVVSPVFASHGNTPGARRRLCSTAKAAPHTHTLSLPFSPFLSLSSIPTEKKEEDDNKEKWYLHNHFTTGQR